MTDKGYMLLSGMFQCFHLDTDVIQSDVQRIKRRIRF